MPKARLCLTIQAGTAAEFEQRGCFPVQGDIELRARYFRHTRTFQRRYVVAHFVGRRVRTLRGI